MKEGESVDARELLVRASARLVENWGVFEQAPPLDDGAFAHEAGVRALDGGRGRAEAAGCRRRRHDQNTPG